jgi:hypothetical protein
MATSKKRSSKARADPIWMYRLRITLLDVEPAAWRVVLVPETITLPKLHAVIQTAMGWTNSHLHEFVIGGRRYSDSPEEEWEPGQIADEGGVMLETALGKAARTFDYVYDFGDDWHHAIVLEERQPLPPDSSSTVRCLAGERACPPEDAGGAYGYADFLEAIADPKHPDHHEMLEWCGGEYDPAHFDIDRVNTMLKRIKA